MKTKLLRWSSFIILVFYTQSLLATEVSVCKPEKINSSMTTIAFAPLILYLLILITIFWKLQLEKYKIGDSLKENQTVDISIDNPSYIRPETTPAQGVQNGAAAIPPVVPPIAPPPTANPTPPFVGKTIQPQSMSRLLAFISGLVTLGLASCFSSFWLYRYFECGTGTELRQITEVLLTLGLGLVPYAVNKISTAASK